MHNRIRKFICFFSLSLSAKSTPYFSVYNSAPKYNTTSPHVDYVNPDAPKVGTLKMATVGTFDGLNPFSIINIVNKVMFRFFMTNQTECLVVQIQV